MPSVQMNVSCATAPALYATMRSASDIVRGSPSPTLTCHCTPSASPPADTFAGPAAGPEPFVAAPPLPWTTIVAPHLRQRIFTILPWTFSSATLYFDWQDWQVIFMWARYRCAPVYLDPVRLA